MTDYTIAAVDEALALLLLVAQKPGLGVTELAARSGNLKARTFRLLYTLEQRNFIKRVGAGPAYQLDVNSLYVGVAAQEQIDLVRIARPHILELATLCNENVQLRVRDGLESLSVDRWQSNHPVRFRSEAGSRRTLFAGAASKVLLAYAPPEIQKAVLNGDLPRYSSSTITQRSKLVQELDRIRAQGFGISTGEITKGVVAISAPVRDATGTVVAALSMSGPDERMHSRTEEFIKLVCGFADRISQSLATNEAPAGNSRP